MTESSRRIRRVIGIDPGSVRAGYGIVDGDGSRLRRVASGTIACGDRPLGERLVLIYGTIAAMCREHEPTEGAIEAIFHQKNAQSALKLGHARGAAMLALAHAGLEISDYAPTVVKKAVTGRGRADKLQVRSMVEMLLGVTASGSHDETDALAIAICHMHRNPQLTRNPR